MYQSKAESEFAHLLEFNRIEHFRNIRFSSKRGFQVDFFLPEYHAAVEIDGGVHRFLLDRDMEKDVLADAEGLVLFRIIPKLRHYQRVKQYVEVIKRIQARDFSKLMW